MGSRVKKDRRKSGVKFVKQAKTPNPLADRHEFRETVRQPDGLRNAGAMVPRAEGQLKKARREWGLEA